MKRPQGRRPSCQGHIQPWPTAKAPVCARPSGAVKRCRDSPKDAHPLPCVRSGSTEEEKAGSGTAEARAGEATGLCGDVVLSLGAAMDSSAHRLCTQWTCFQEDRQPCSNQRGLRAKGGHPAAKGRQTSSLSRSNNAGVRGLQTELPERARAADRPSGNAVGTYVREPGGESRGITVAPGACRVHPWQTATRRQLWPRE